MNAAKQFEKVGRQLAAEREEKFKKLERLSRWGFVASLHPPPDRDNPSWSWTRSREFEGSSVLCVDDGSGIRCAFDLTEFPRSKAEFPPLIVVRFDAPEGCFYNRGAKREAGTACYERVLQMLSVDLLRLHILGRIP